MLVEELINKVQDLYGDDHSIVINNDETLFVDYYSEESGYLNRFFEHYTDIMKENPDED